MLIKKDEFERETIILPIEFSNWVPTVFLRMQSFYDAISSSTRKCRQISRLSAENRENQKSGREIEGALRHGGWGMVMKSWSSVQ